MGMGVGTVVRESMGMEVGDMGMGMGMGVTILFLVALLHTDMLDCFFSSIPHPFIRANVLLQFNLLQSHLTPSCLVQYLSGVTI